MTKPLQDISKERKNERSGLRKCKGHRIAPGNRLMKNAYWKDLWDKDGRCAKCGGVRGEWTRV